ncbi:hypothetical protein N7453_005407 [Penicillium expansum]|nr:hypothetical protein N7453_005407 [Penicillium expansum]
MPPKGSPHKSGVPILRKHTWCMTCLRVTVRDRTEARQPRFSLWSCSVMPRHMTARTASTGRNCTSPAKPYCFWWWLVLTSPSSKVPKGVGGNRYELLACLSWVQQFWANDDDEEGPIGRAETWYNRLGRDVRKDRGNCARAVWSDIVSQK